MIDDDSEDGDWVQRQDLKANPGKVGLPDDLSLLIGGWTSKDVTARVYAVLEFEKRTIPKDFTFDGMVDNHHVIVTLGAEEGGRRTHRVFFVLTDDDGTETLVSCGRIVEFMKARQDIW